jgi:hypothetical protein
MATWDDVDRLARGLPEVDVGERWNNRTWQVAGKGFVWVRPLSKKDRKLLGDAAPPDDVILAAKVEHEVAKQALLADGSGVFFTTPHFNGYPAILVRLDQIGSDALEEVVTEAWLVTAPATLAKAYLEEHDDPVA